MDPDNKGSISQLPSKPVGGENTALMPAFAFIHELIARGGPLPEEYEALTANVDAMAAEIAAGELNEKDVLKYWRDLAERYFKGSVQGHTMLAPRGYHGDFEAIDLIYRNHVSNDPHQERWDRYFHAHAAPKAVRNRKEYFHELLNRVAAQSSETVHVLNIASGPGRDIHDWLAARSDAEVFFDCVELDPNAIEYARQLCSRFADKMHFHRANALRFHAPRLYRLVWSAGLFDYLTDSLFVRLLRRFMRFTSPGGEIVVGNFGDYNPTRNYMEVLGGWKLNHRSHAQLTALAIDAGADRTAISIGEESEGVNLFLHIVMK